jgi:4-amino-4-deoxy-L-arabinose transferase-like glycosyltransferase
MLGLILIAALALRLQGLNFGLPGLYDPDEPIFMLCALKLLRDHTLNPGWFGHPGSTTIYVMAVVQAATFVIGHILGYFPTQAAFVDAVYADPGLIFLPGRLFFACCGVACVALTYFIGRRAFDRATGLVAAALLAVNAVHVQWSQVIRTDVHASVFMLGAIWFAIGIVQRGRVRDYAGAAVMVGLACATKWPAATVICAVIGAAVVRIVADPANSRRHASLLASSVGLAIVSTVIASPYLLLDVATVAANVGGEAQSGHLGATGGGFGHNVIWYIATPVEGSFGLIGLVMIAIGIVAALAKNRAAIATVLLPFAIFLVVISAQDQIWARWIVPILPLFAILAALGVVTVSRRLVQSLPRRRGRAAVVALCVAVLFPMVWAQAQAAAERGTDTRTLAAQWVIANVPHGETVAVEHFAFKLSGAGFRILFPAGPAGCVDAMALLGRRVSYAQTSHLRGQAALVDFGTVPTERLPTCHARTILVSDLDRYLAERGSYQREIAAYRRLLAGGTLVATIGPRRGLVGGPTVRVYRFAE